MRSSFFAAGAVLAGLAAAAPAPQDIDFDLADSVPNPVYTTTLSSVSYDPTSILASAMPQITASQSINDTDASSTDAAPERRAATACAPQPTGAGPIPSPDSASAFAVLPAFSSAAVNAPVPSGYSQTFSNLNASNNAYGYMGYTTLSSYNVTACANKCNKINGCMAFNIYFERDPSVDPGSGSTGCTNPASTTNIKCVWWGGPVTSDNALNQGQWRNQFQVVIAGSNGYVNNTLATPAGYTSPVDLGNAAINAPYDEYGFNSFLGSAIFNSGPFSLQLCADACSKKSAYAIAHPPTDGSPVETCQFFNTYILYINTTANLQGQYCAMYSESWPTKYATNVGQYRGNDHYLIEYSYAVSNATNPGAADPNAAVHQASKDISYATLQPFCSTYLGYTTTATVTVTPTPTPAGGRVKRTSVASMPPVLTKYPSAILSSACSLQATPATATVTATPTPSGCGKVATGGNFAIQASYNSQYAVGGQGESSVVTFTGVTVEDGQPFYIDSNGYLIEATGTYAAFKAEQDTSADGNDEEVFFASQSRINDNGFLPIVCNLNPSTCALACSVQGNSVYAYGAHNAAGASYDVEDQWFLGVSGTEMQNTGYETVFDTVYAVGLS